MTDEQFREILRAVPGSLMMISLGVPFEPAMEIGDQTSNSFYDCLYIAAAERWSRQLTTADEKLVRRRRNTRWMQQVCLLRDYTAA